MIASPHVLLPDLAGDLAVALDPVRLMAKAGMVADPWQRSVLRTGAQQVIMLASRQSGKSSVSSVLAIHQAVYQPDSLVLVLSPSLRQSQELYRKTRAIYAALGGEVPKPAEESALRLELSNGSRVISLPGKESTVRGFSGASLLLVDEASRVPDALYMAIRPMVAVSGGRIALLSTPFGRRGFFHHEWTEGGDDWHRAMVTAFDCPRIGRGWLARERARVGEWWFRQEFLVEFVDTDDQVFSSADIAAALTADVSPLFPIGGRHATATA